MYFEDESDVDRQDSFSADESELEVRNTKIESIAEEKDYKLEAVCHPLVEMLSVPEKAKKSLTPKRKAQNTADGSRRKRSIKIGATGSREFQ